LRFLASVARSAGFPRGTSIIDVPYLIIPVEIEDDEPKLGQLFAVDGKD
jgi:hypothetical protein